MKTKFTTTASGLTLLALTVSGFPASAELFDKSYVVVASQYSNIDLDFTDEGQAGVTLAFGTEIEKKWNVEFGYSFMADNYKLPGDLSAVTAGQSMGIDASAWHAAFLGKARGNSGVLFYKIGLMHSSFESAAVVEQESCSRGVAIAPTETVNGPVICQIDESSIAGLVGMGFDYNVTEGSQVRFNVDYVFGENSLQATLFQVGYRYNF